MRRAATPICKKNAAPTDAATLNVKDATRHNANAWPNEPNLPCIQWLARPPPKSLGKHADGGEVAREETMQLASRTKLN
eukprot:6961715-Lingulodinium_polyedra.AAC.1